jgi:Na+/proline symporter
MTFAVIFMLVVLLFLFLGGLLQLFAESKGIAARGDSLFPTIALEYMPGAVSIIFIIALISALFPSADGAITALTSSFCIDILGINRNANMDDKEKKRTRQIVHLTFAALFLLMVMVFKWMNNPSMIGLILKIAAFTYGPLLGLFAFGILTKRSVNDPLVPVVVVISPVLCFILDMFQSKLFGGYQIGLELLFINGLLTFLGLCLIPWKKEIKNA